MATIASTACRRLPSGFGMTAGLLVVLATVLPAADPNDAPSLFGSGRADPSWMSEMGGGLQADHKGTTYRYEHFFMHEGGLLASATAQHSPKLRRGLSLTFSFQKADRADPGVFLLVARSATGAEVFRGEMDTPKKREAFPPQVREALGPGARFDVGRRESIQNHTSGMVCWYNIWLPHLEHDDAETPTSPQP